MIMGHCTYIILLLCAILASGSAQVIVYERCSNGTVWTPQPGTSWYWNLGTSISTATVDSNPAQVYDFDMFYVTSDVINYIHSLNHAKKFHKSILGHPMEGWPGERWVNIRSDTVRQIMADRLNQAWQLGCDAIEWDDVDSYENNPGFHITATDQLNFNVYLARITHEYNMSAGLKNDLDQIPTLVDYFDWALDEQCYQYDECDTEQPFIDQGKAVFGAEYQGSASSECPALNALGYSWIFTDINVDSSATQCCSFMSPPCPRVDWRCLSPPTTYPVFSGSSYLFINKYVTFVAILIHILWSVI